MEMMWGMPGMIVVGLVFWGFVAAGAVAVAWWLLRRSRASPRDTALDVLRERYAKGDPDLSLRSRRGTPRQAAGEPTARQP